MGIIAIYTDTPGQINTPNLRRVKIITTDNLATVTTAGYLNPSSLQGYVIYNTDEIVMWYGATATASGVTNPGTLATFSASISNGVITLVTLVNPGDVLLPVVANHIAIFNGTTGQITGDLSPAINGGNIQAGLSGTAGTLASYPATAAKGSFIFAGVANTGNTTTTLSNAAMGQASVISIPDPGNALGELLIGATATPFVSGNFPQNSGTAGLMVDSGLAVSNVVSKVAANTFTGVGSIILPKVNGTESGNAVTASGVAGVITTSSLSTAGGSSYAITWTNTVMTSTSVVLLTIAGGTNTTENITLKIAPGNGTSTLTIYNNTAATALDRTILISYLVI